MTQLMNTLIIPFLVLYLSACSSIPKNVEDSSLVQGKYIQYVPKENPHFINEELGIV